MKRILGLWLVAWAAMTPLAGCNPPADYALVGSAFVPSAHGDIDVEGIDKNQLLVNITIDHLPNPAEIEAGLTHYVVWFTPVGEYPARQGTLDYDPEARTGRAAIPTSMLEFDVQITAESSDSPTQPSDLIVASQKIREK